MRFHFLQDLVRDGAEDGCDDNAWDRRVHAHALRAQFAAAGFGKADHARFAGGIVALTKVAVNAHHRTGTLQNGRLLPSALFDVANDDDGALLR